MTLSRSELLEALGTQIAAHAEILAQASRHKADADRLRRAWAVYELHDTPVDCIERYADWLESDGYVPAEVIALIRSGAGLPIGECDRCGERGPLKPARDGHMALDSRDCAWGCAGGKEPADGG